MTKPYPAGTKLRFNVRPELKYVVVYHDQNSLLLERITDPIISKVGERLLRTADQFHHFEPISPRKLQVGDQYQSIVGVVTVMYINKKGVFTAIWDDNSLGVYDPKRGDSCVTWTPIGEAPKLTAR